MKTPTKKQKLSFDLTQFRFLGNFLLVKAIRPETTTGLVKPEQYDDKPEFGEVISMGGNVDLGISLGSVIWFGKYSSEQVRVNGDDYYVIQDEDVKGVLDKSSLDKSGK